MDDRESTGLFNTDIARRERQVLHIQSNLCTHLKGSVKEPNMFHNCETEKITRKASDAAENLQLYRAVRFFRPRSLRTTHLMLFSERPPIYASCMTISYERTEQHVVIGFGELAAVD